MNLFENLQLMREANEENLTYEKILNDFSAYLVKHYNSSDGLLPKKGTKLPFEKFELYLNKYGYYEDHKSIFTTRNPNATNGCVSYNDANGKHSAEVYFDDYNEPYVDTVFFYRHERDVQADNNIFIKKSNNKPPKNLHLDELYKHMITVMKDVIEESLQDYRDGKWRKDKCKYYYKDEVLPDPAALYIECWNEDDVQDYMVEDVIDRLVKKFNYKKSDLWDEEEGYCKEFMIELFKKLGEYYYDDLEPISYDEYDEEDNDYYDESLKNNI